VNVLLTNHEMLMPGGSETYCFTMAEELKRLGHEPIIYTPKPGTYAHFVQQTIPILPIVHELKKIDFDAAIIQSAVCWNAVRELQCFKIWNINAPFDLGIPPEQVHRITSISEETQKEAENHSINSIVVRNGIDCEKFKPRRQIREKLTKVLMITNHFPGVVNIVKEACKLAKVDFQHIGHPRWVTNQQDYINTADLVISLGRGIYEAMACGRNCIVFDYNGAAGFVTPDDYEKMKWYNCSGRLRGMKWNAERLAEEFKKYDTKLGPELREIALQKHNIKTVIEGHLDAISRYMDQHKSIPPELYQETLGFYQ